MLTNFFDFIGYILFICFTDIEPYLYEKKDT